jgi:hypothetical protein
LGRVGRLDVRSLREQLQREVASLYAFVETVSRACVPPPQSVSYSESSNTFFDYVGHLADCTKRHIAGFDGHAEDDAEGFVEARTELWTLRTAWRDLHQFIKPSADADTLNQPTAMVAALVNRLRELPSFESTDFTIFHTDSFDYAQVSPSAMEAAMTQLARIVNANQFPSNLGLIGIPNSQGNALFFNCLLAHEIGEYVYAKQAIEASLAAVAATALEKHEGAEFSAAPLTLQSRMTKIVLQYAKEIFCDMFAVRLVGPCYSFAYIELFDLLNLVHKDGTLIVSDDARPPILSYYAYPSHPFRMKVQADLLKAEGWWDAIKDMDSRQCAVLQGLLGLGLNDFIQAEEAVASDRVAQMKALVDIMPHIRTQLGNVTAGIDPRTHEYGLLWRPIAEYLRNGIVPSTLNIPDSASTLKEVHATPITLLNAAYRFYLEGVEELMSGIKGQDLSSAQDRAAWMKRIEKWTTKALEDVALFGSSES